MKKSIVLILMIMILSLIIVGCINYKTTAKDPSDENLLKEITAIEQELEGDAITESAEIKSAEIKSAEIEPQESVEEIIIPELESANPGLSETSSELPEPETIVTVKENQKVTLRPKVMDPDHDEVTITYSTPLNSQGEWQTKYGDAGEYTVTVSATDGTTSASKMVKIVVKKDNVAPVIENLKDLAVKEGERVSFTPMVTDLNGDKVTVTISTPLTEGEFKTDFNSAGSYPITVAASDGELETTKIFMLTVNNVNQKPLIKNAEEVLVKEGETLQLIPQVEDPDGDEVTVSISEPVGEDGQWKLSYIDHGEYLITITANDGTDTVSKKVKVSVEDVNAPVEFIDIVVDVN